MWSLGLSMIEIGLGRYPYPPETYSNVFAQLTAIVHGDPPELDETKYSEVAREWVAMCLRKDPERRASYRELLVSFFYFFFAVVVADRVIFIGPSVFEERRDE